MRSDISAALDELPAQLRKEATTTGCRSLEFLDAHLNPDEQVRHIASAAARPDAPKSCLLVVTSRRLIFVAPAPQAVAWELSLVSKHQAHGGYFFIEGDGGKYAPGLDAEWGAMFEAQVARAVAMAVLSAA